MYHVRWGYDPPVGGDFGVTSRFAGHDFYLQRSSIEPLAKGRSRSQVVDVFAGYVVGYGTICPNFVFLVRDPSSRPGSFLVPDVDPDIRKVKAPYFILVGELMHLQAMITHVIIGTVAFIHPPGKDVFVRRHTEGS